MQFKELDRVLLKDGREGTIVAGTPNGPFAVDVGTTPETWDSIFVEASDIAKIISE